MQDAKVTARMNDVVVWQQFGGSTDLRNLKDSVVEHDFALP